MKVLIIEDQPPAQRILKKFIEDHGQLTLLATFSDAIAALDFLKKQPVDLIFLDIHLPKISGIEFLKTLTHPPQIILTTAFPDYALESYELDVVDYLLKPFSFHRFVKAVAKVREKVNWQNTESQPLIHQDIFIKSGYEYIKINTADILFIRSDADYTELHTGEGQKLLSAEPLKHWIDTLSPQFFIQVHKSYVINLQKIAKFMGSKINLISGVEIPIGRAYKDAFVQRVM